MKPTAPRVLYLGTTDPFSYPPLAALLEAGLPVAAVAVPRRARVDLPMLGDPPTPTLLDLARRRGIPIHEIGGWEETEIETLAACRPDVICVACFPRRLPRSLLTLPRWGALNLHPSLLPAHRGPDPLFWTFRHGDARAGVTVHIMDDRVDSGDLLLQTPVPIPEGITGPELERRCAVEGGKLLVEAVRSLPAGKLTPRPQRPEEGSYESWPTPRDLEVPVTRPARWAFRFIRGVGDWYPLTVPVADTRRAVWLRVRRALAVLAEEEVPALHGQPYLRIGHEAWVRFTPGVLHLEVE